MSEYVRIDGDPNEVHGTAARLEAMGARMDSAAQSAISKINSLAGSAPWGNDDYGTAFLETYNQKTAGADGSAGALSDVVQQDLGATGPAMTKLGGDVSSAIASYTLNDSTSSADIGKLAR